MNPDHTEKYILMHVLTTLETGGMENGVINICNRIDRSVFRPLICCTKNTGPMVKRLKQDVRVINLQNAEGKDFFRPVRLMRIFLKEKPDVVHTHGWGADSFSGIVGAKLAGVPVIINGEHGGFFLKPYQVGLQRLLASMCNMTLSVSFALRSRIQDELAIPKSKIKVIQNGVDTIKFAKKPDRDFLIRDIADVSGIKIKETDFLVCMIGSLKPAKNQMMVLNALCELKQVYDDESIKLLFIGEGPDKKRLRDYVRENSLSRQVVFLGLRNDVPDILSLSDILVSASISEHEGMSNVILEAMAASVAVISSSSVGAQELINDGENGMIVDPLDHKAFAQKIQQMRNKPSLRANIAENARRMAEEKFSLGKMIRNYEQVYLQCLAKKKR